MFSLLIVISRASNVEATLLCMSLLQRVPEVYENLSDSSILGDLLQGNLLFKKQTFPQQTFKTFAHAKE